VQVATAIVNRKKMFLQLAPNACYSEVLLNTNINQLNYKIMYKYEELKKEIFTEDGQVMFLKIRDNANRLLKQSEAFSMNAVIKAVSGDTWKMMACVDRLIELGEIKEITEPNKVAGQNRIFVSAVS
jgi:hypothetical protein